MEATLLAYPLFNCIQPLIATAAIGNFPQTTVCSIHPTESGTGCWSNPDSRNSLPLGECSSVQLADAEDLLPPALPARQPQRRLAASAEQCRQGHQHKTALQQSRVGQGELRG